MDSKRVEIEVRQGELDESERKRIRERILDRDCEYDVIIEEMKDRIRGSEGKLRRIWYTIWVCAVLFGAWVDGRFGFALPNVVESEPVPTETIGPVEFPFTVDDGLSLVAVDDPRGTSARSEP